MIITNFNWSAQRVLVVGTHAGNKFPLWRGIEQGLAELQRLGATTMNVSIDDVIPAMPSLMDFQPTATIVVSSRIYKLGAIKSHIQQLPGRHALWHNDLVPVGTGHEPLKGMFHLLFMCWSQEDGDYALTKWRDVMNAPTAYMPQGAPLTPELVQVENPTHRVVFIGDHMGDGYHLGRREACRALKAKVFNENHREKRLAIELDSPRIYRDAKYSLAYSLPTEGYNSLRMYNILSYGGLLLVKWFPGIEELMINRHHALFFSNHLQATKLCAEFDNKADTREAIQIAGWKLQSEKHTGIQRLQNMTYALATGDTRFWGYL